MKNLLQIDSKNLSYLDALHEYQKVYINNNIGDILNHTKLDIKRSDDLYIKPIEDIEIVWQTFEKYYKVFSLYDDRILIIDDNFIAEIFLNYRSSYIGALLSLASDNIENTQKYIKEIKECIKEFLIDDNTIIDYKVLQYESRSSIDTIYYQDTININFNPLAVPFIKDTDSYIEKFLNSSSPLLILHGEPGTGKTTFVKYILSTMAKKSQQKIKALYSFDEDVFYSNQFYKTIIHTKYDILILEDINQIIHKNVTETTEINPINKFISVTDGLLKKNIKVIITSNIDSKNQLHHALLRPGRCFDTLFFRNLQGVEIDDLCDSCATDLDLQIESINISEFYAHCNNEQNTQSKTTKIGF